MKAIVVYYSKTGNTKTIAEAISKEINCPAISLNIRKKGRKTKEEKLNVMDKNFDEIGL